jgi:hypothetical protein
MSGVTKDLCVPHLPKHSVLKVHPCGGKGDSFFSFHDRIIFHCMDRSFCSFVTGLVGYVYCLILVIDAAVHIFMWTCAFHSSWEDWVLLVPAGQLCSALGLIATLCAGSLPCHPLPSQCFYPLPQLLPHGLTSSPSSTLTSSY